jgi:hypothetical protein
MYNHRCRKRPAPCDRHRFAAETRRGSAEPGTGEVERGARAARSRSTREQASNAQNNFLSCNELPIYHLKHFQHEPESHG